MSSRVQMRGCGAGGVAELKILGPSPRARRPRHPHCKCRCLRLLCDPVQSASPTTTPSQTQSATPSVSRQPFALLLVGKSVPVTRRSFNESAAAVAITDAAAPALVLAWLSRCPGVGVSMRCAAFAGASSSSLLPQAALQEGAAILPFVQAAPRGGSDAGACDPASDAPVLLPPVAAVGAVYGTGGGTAALSCQVYRADAGDSLGFATTPLTVTPTLWPVWEDAILVAPSGIMRSARLSITLNATAALRAAGADAAASCGDPLLASGPGCISRLDNSTLSVAVTPAAVISVAEALWGAVPLPSNDGGGSLTLTLTASSLILLRSPRYAFRNGTNATLGGAPCPVLAVSPDGLWALLQTPSPAQLCGSDAVDCGYSTLRVRAPPSPPGAGAFSGGALACPPVCPGSISPPTSLPAVFDVGADAVLAALGRDPSTGGAALTALPSASQGGGGSRGIFYSLACAQTGLFTDPSTGACTNASDPASYACAYGSGAGCKACPVGSLCPGGFRLWPRPGYWVASEAAATAIACPAPDAATRCPGWSAATAAAGTSSCGAGYLAGSYLCSACARGHYPTDTGTCAACPVLVGPWDKYRGLLLLLAGVAAFVLAAGAGLYVLLRCVVGAGSLTGGARQLFALGVWSLMALQTFSQVSRVSSPALPPLLAATYRGVAVLQLQGILLHPSCTNA